MTAPRRLPPHGKQFADGRARGLSTRLLGLGNLTVLLDWKQPSAGVPFIVIPPDTDLERCNLNFVTGWVIAIVHDDSQAHRVQEVFDALLDAGASRVSACNRDGLRRGEDLNDCWPEVIRHAC